MKAHASTTGRDRLLALVVWAVAAAFAAGAWHVHDSGVRISWLLSLVALYLAVFGWNLWTNRYSREGDALIHAMGCNLPWLVWWRRP